MKLHLIAKQQEKKKYQYIKIVNFYVIITLFFFSIGCTSPNSKKIDQAQINSQWSSNTIVQNDMEFLFEKLSLCFANNDKKGVQKIWDSIIIKKFQAVKYLTTFKDSLSTSRWYWYPIKSYKLMSRSVTFPTQENAALFYIYAIIFEDISFAYSRNIYNNSYVNLNFSEDKNYIEEIKLAYKMVDLKLIWRRVDTCYNNSLSPNTLKLRNEFWVGEKAGKMSIFNIERFPKQAIN